MITFLILGDWPSSDLTGSLVSGSASGLWRQLRLAAEMTMNEMASWKICIHIYIYIYIHYIDGFVIGSILLD